MIRGDEPHLRGKKGKSTLQEKVGVFYYTLGLFCITYPVWVLCFAVLIIVVTWLPLVNVSFPGKAPHMWMASYNATDTPQPFCYIQQVVLRVAVLPWRGDLTLGDAFRAPLYEAFKLLDIVRNYQDERSLKTLGNICLHIEAIKRSKNEKTNVLPQYSCLLLSPANLWNQDAQQFAQDSTILSTIFNHHTFQKGKTSVSDMVFGMHLFDTGIKRYPLRNRPRIIQYAMTLFFKEYDQQFVEGLREKLTTVYPLHQDFNQITNHRLNDTILIEYPGEINYIEAIPLFMAFTLLFLYYYFSVRKIEIIKSKLGMAFTATFTIFCNLTMTMGICFFFGLTLSSDGGKGIIPYLTLLVGLENVLVLTKSVVATPLHLDVKIRNAQGLSNEGWSITKNLLLEITVLTFGLFTFVPEIQEFCIFSIVALITDYFLQMFFFLTILGLDMNRMAHAIEKMSQKLRNNLYQQQSFFDKPFTGVKGLVRSKSHPRLTSFPANIVAAQKQGPLEKKIPKRVKLVNIWARTRIFQRSFMLLMIIYISIIAYNSDLMNQYILKAILDEKTVENGTVSSIETISTVGVYPMLTTNHALDVNYVTYNPLDQDQHNQTKDLERLKHPEYAPWLKLPARHWSAILRKYNITLSGQVIAVLPNIKLSQVVRPEQAMSLRNPNEKYGDKFQWQALAVALDPIEFRDESLGTNLPQSEQPFYPTSPMEIFLTTILCLISVIVLAYAFVVLYRCICSRNYAEWRASWFNEKVESEQEDQVLLEAMPISLEGHSQEIECIATDGTNIVSACLAGQLKIFDSNTAELICQIDRKSFFTAPGTPNQSADMDETFSDFESGSPPSRDDLFPKLLNKIDTDFSHNTDDDMKPFDSKYNFNKSFRHFYFDHNFDVRLRNRNKEEFGKRHSLNMSTNKRLSINSEESDVRIRKDNTGYNRLSSSGDNKKSAEDVEECIREFQSFTECKLSQIWCMDYLDNLIVIGCANGRLEFWEASSGHLKCIFEDGTESGINHVKIVGAKVIAVRLCGSLELLQLQTYNQGRPIDWNFTIAYRRMHVRTASVGSISEQELKNKPNSEEDLRCIKIQTVKAHQQPVTCLDCEGGRILTGSQDHTLKVFRLDDVSPLYTLHGHCGPITCLFIDRVSPATSGSGSQDGMLCVWDLLTGACMYSIQAHDGSINSLTYSASYVISQGADDRLCVWERFQGHLLNTINVSQTFSSKVLMLAQHLVVTGRSGGLIIWDVRTGDCVRTITLGRGPFVFINQLVLLRDAVLCDYGKQLMIVRFPLMTDKFD